MLFKEEHGSVAVITVLILVSLLTATALAIDGGQLYLTRSKLQKAADAAALAGAQAWMTTNDESEAQAASSEYIDANSDRPVNSTINVDTTANSVSIKLAKQVDFFFAPVIGIPNKTVTVAAKAMGNVIVKMKNVVPFGVVNQTFEYGQQYVLKYGAGSGGQYCGNFGALALGGNGANNYRNNLKYGYQGEVAVGDEISTEPGNMAGPTDQGVSYRKAQCTHGCNFATQIEANCPRVVITPVIDSLDVKGRKKVTVVGFAAFFLEETQESESKGQKDVVGRFLRWATVGEWGEGSNYGVYSVRLIE